MKSENIRRSRLCCLQRASSEIASWLGHRAGLRLKLGSSGTRTRPCRKTTHPEVASRVQQKQRRLAEAVGLMVGVLLRVSDESISLPAVVFFPVWRNEAHRHCTVFGHRQVRVSTRGYQSCCSCGICRVVPRAGYIVSFAFRPILGANLHLVVS